MAKMTGAKKKAFLARMARGRAKAKHGGKRKRSSAKRKTHPSKLHGAAKAAWIKAHRKGHKGAKAKRKAHHKGHRKGTRKKGLTATLKRKLMASTLPRRLDSIEDNVYALQRFAAKQIVFNHHVARKIDLAGSYERPQIAHRYKQLGSGR
jgi:hypothetical protein